MTNTAQNIEQDLPTSPAQLLQRLDEIQIIYKIYEHEPMFTVADGEHIKDSIPGIHCRNLFIRDKKETMFLVVARNETKINMKKLQALLDCGRLSFGSEKRLWQYLGIRPGSVCPFTIMNDKENHVRVILDKSMMDSDELLNYHPLDNAMTIGISPDDLLKFIKECNHEPVIMDLSPAAPDEEK